MNLAAPEERSQVIVIVVFAFGILFSGQSIVWTLTREQPGKERATALLIQSFQLVLMIASWTKNQ
jgi:hypothetical protein